MKKRNIMGNKSYSELRRFETFDDRFAYLKLEGRVGQATFGFDRHINQGFYMSSEWKNARDEVIVRDNGCDLGIAGHEINTELLVHHMNPMLVDDIIHGEEYILDPEYLITTTKRTHNAIHFGFAIPHPKIVITRTINDTKLW
jgi:hypothetical protein